MQLILTGTGTSQGIPVITCDCEVCTSDDPRDKRLRTSAVLQTGNTSIVIDTGPDFRQQMLRNNIHKVDAVLLTHQHQDHIGGMDDLRPYIFSQEKPMDIYAGIETIKTVKKEYFYAFEQNKYPGAPDYNLHQLDNREFRIHELTIIPIFATHGDMPVWGFRFGNTAYLTDAKALNEEEINKLFNLDVLVINAICRKYHHSHFTLEEALELIKRVNPGKAYITHISHDMGKQAEISKLLPPNVFLGYDNLKINCPDPF